MGSCGFALTLFTLLMGSSAVMLVAGDEVPCQFYSTLYNHNSYCTRWAKPAVPALVWNNTLAKLADAYLKTCRYGHDPRNAAVRIGENIWASSGYSNAPQDALERAPNAWWIESNVYSFDNPALSIGVFGHFTQVVWKSTVSIGCAAVTNCPSIIGATGGGPITGVLCKYYPTGNVLYPGTDMYKLFKGNVSRIGKPGDQCCNAL